MSYQPVKRHEETLNDIVKWNKLKRIRSVWFRLYDMVEKEKLWMLPEIGDKWLKKRKKIVS